MITVLSSDAKLWASPGVIENGIDLLAGNVVADDDDDAIFKENQKLMVSFSFSRIPDEDSDDDVVVVDIDVRVVSDDCDEPRVALSISISIAS